MTVNYYWAAEYEIFLTTSFPSNHGSVFGCAHSDLSFQRPHEACRDPNISTRRTEKTLTARMRRLKCILVGLNFHNVHFHMKRHTSCKSTKYFTRSVLTEKKKIHIFQFWIMNEASLSVETIYLPNKIVSSTSKGASGSNMASLIITSICQSEPT